MKDLTKIKAGDTLILRDGGRQICTRNSCMIKSDTTSWYPDGTWRGHKETTGFDIIDYEPAPERREFKRWVAWDFDSEFEELTALDCDTEQEAMEIAKRDGTIIAITPVTFKEGQGL